MHILPLFQMEPLPAVLLLTDPSFQRNISMSSLLLAVHADLVHMLHLDVLAKVSSDLHLAKAKGHVSLFIVLSLSAVFDIAYPSLIVFCS